MKSLVFPKKFNKFSEAAGLFLLFTAGSVNLCAGQPSLINYQGKLIQGTNPVTGAISLTFRVFTNATGGNFIYEENQQVNVVNGLYSTFLGQNPTTGTIDDAVRADCAFLEVTVNGNPLQPREKFTPPPFAKRSTERWNLFLYRSFDGGYDPSASAFLFDVGPLQSGWVASWTTGTLFACGTPCYGWWAVFPPARDKVTIVAARYMVLLPGQANTNYVTSLVLSAEPFGGTNRSIGSPVSFDLHTIPIGVWQAYPLPASPGASDVNPGEIVSFRAIPSWAPPGVAVNVLFEVEVK
jgi:hypothetical protein